jgi:hypothetical protein
MDLFQKLLDTNQQKINAKKFEAILQVELIDNILHQIRGRVNSK